MTSAPPIDSVVVIPGDARVTDVSDRGAVSVPIRIARRFDELAQALNRRLRVPAYVAEAEAPVPGRGTIVVCRPDVLHRLAETSPACMPWVVAVDLDRTEVLERSERLSLAAAIEVVDYLAWLSSAAQPPALFGRKEIAPRIGATTDSHPLRSSRRYVRMWRDDGDLPVLLADYLAAYAAAELAQTP